MDRPKSPHLTMSTISDQQIRDWLLHRLDAVRERELEEQLFADDEFERRLSDAGADLIDDFARSGLDADERALVARHLLATPGDRQRLGFARALQALVAQGALSDHAGSARRRSLVRRFAWGLSIAAGVLFAVGVPFRTDIQTWYSGARAGRTHLPAITLLASAQRGDAPPMVLPARAPLLRLQVEIDDDTDAQARFALDVADSAHVLFNARDLPIRSVATYRFVEAVVPARALGPGPRRVTLTNLAPAARPPVHWDITTRDAE